MAYKSIAISLLTEFLERFAQKGGGGSGRCCHAMQNHSIRAFLTTKGKDWILRLTRRMTRRERAATKNDARYYKKWDDKGTGRQERGAG